MTAAKWRVNRETIGKTQSQAYTPTMTLKNAALFALIGMTLLTVLLLAGFIRDMVTFLNNAISALALLTSLINLLASLSLTVFLFAFHKSQS
jgi:hypothetical protein